MAMAGKSAARAPLPPIPTDPKVCRWCHGRKRAFIEGGQLEICNAGCAPNDQAPYLGHCQECGRDFETGRRLLDAPLCDECDADAIGQAMYDRRPATGKVEWSADVRMRMRSRKL